MFLYSSSSNSSGSKSKKESIAGIYTSTNPSSLSSIGFATKPLNSLNSGLVELILKYSKILSPPCVAGSLVFRHGVHDIKELICTPKT